MITNPFVALLHSRKFLIAMWDFIVGFVALVAGWFLVPEDLDKIVQVFALLQVPVSILIGAIAWEDNAQRRLEGEIAQAEVWQAEPRTIVNTEGEGNG